MKDIKKELEENDDQMIHQDIIEALKDKEKVSFYYSMYAAKQRAQRKGFYIKAFSVSCLIALLISVTFVVKGVLKPKTNDEIFAEYFTIDYPDVTTRSLSADKDLLQNALSEFDRRNFHKATDLLERYTKSQPENYVAKYYLSTLYIQSQNYYKAILLLESISDCEKSLVCESIRWNLALCYLKTKDNLNAVNTLKWVAKDKNNFYHNQASEILVELEKRK